MNKKRYKSVSEMMNDVCRHLVKYSKTTERSLGSVPINCSLEEMRPLFETKDDKYMVFCYDITTPEQIAFFKSKGVPITKRSNWVLEAHYENYSNI